MFNHSLDLVIKSRDTMQGFANKIDLCKVTLYNIVKDRKDP